MDADKKRGRYQRIREQLTEVLNVTEDPIAKMATMVGLLHHKMDYFFWTGFYRLVERQLLLGPYQGLLACQNLPKDQGVCWAAVNRKETMVVPNVHEFKGHIACDARVKSEIVVPCKNKKGEIYAVLDVDSDKLNSFDEIDAEELEKIVALL
ncbi:MAG: histidine kinase [Phycisphaerae bacterium SM23_30]|nr:MAG: histidine kinase [Phycisphaerae bacterium SM23_30]